MKVPLSAYEKVWELIKKDAVSAAPVLILVSYDCDAIAACRTLHSIGPFRPSCPEPNLIPMQSLFKLFSIPWTIEPVNSYEDITAVYERFIKQTTGLKSIFMLNCGGAVDLFEELRLYENPSLIVYVLDSHRPFHQNNMKNVNQIMLFDETNEELVVPTAKEKKSKKQRRQEEREERRKQRAAEKAARAEEKRKVKLDRDGDVEMSESSVYDDEDEGDSLDADDDLDDDDEMDDEEEDEIDEDDVYDDDDDVFDEDDPDRRSQRRRRDFKRLEPAGHAFSSAGLMYALATKIEKESNEYLWNGILGLTDQLIHQRIDRRRYLANLIHFKSEVERLNLTDEEIAAGRGSATNEPHRIVYIPQEYAFMLYRQWSLYESMCHTRHIAVRLGLWNAQGIKKLETWLAKMGLPLEQVKQPWKAMKPELKTLLPDLLYKKAGDLDADSLFYPSFVKKPLFDKETAASDTVYAVSALLESTKRLKMQQSIEGTQTDRNTSEDFTKSNFWNAYLALSNQHPDLLAAGYIEAMELQRAIMRQVKSMMQKNEIGSAGPYRHAILRDGPDMKFFCHPLSLRKLAHFLVDVLIETKRYRQSKPLLLVVPNVAATSIAGTMQALTPGGQAFTHYVVVGVPAQHSGAAYMANTFARIFSDAADKTQSPLNFSSFDATVVEIRKDDLFKFIEQFRHSMANPEAE